MTYLRQFGDRQTPQSEPMRSDQVQNASGGFAWSIGKWERFRRFLILGTEGGTYYTDQRKLTVENAQSVRECIAEDGPRVVREIVDISVTGRAAKQDPLLFALAMASGADDKETRILALNAAVDDVCRIGTHIQHFVAYAEQFRGWGRAMRAAAGRWYRENGDAYQLIKYRQRDGWSNRDLLRLAHPKPKTDAENALWGYVTQPDKVGDRRTTLPDQINATERIKTLTDPNLVAANISDFRLPREAVPSEMLKHVVVWEALLQDMPYIATMRNLGVMTANETLKPLSELTQMVAERLVDGSQIERSRVHPLNLLMANLTYGRGAGMLGKGQWNPIAALTESLEKAYYMAFDNIEPSGKRILLALDVSGSMHGGEIAGMPGLTPAIGVAAMAMVTARTEPNYHIMGFADEFRDLGVTASDTLAEAGRKTNYMNFGRTDCALPMVWALENGIDVDLFVIYTDNETWMGSIHPAQALKRYREQRVPTARMAVVGMTATEISIADPNDAGSLDLVGFDTATPQLLAQFGRGEI